MFLDNLSAAVLRFCRAKNLSYEAASEICKLSARYFGDIARGKTAPTILTLEKLCDGFKCTPNELLIATPAFSGILFREPMLVMRSNCYSCYHGVTTYPICPRCNISLEREFQAYCDRCGQCLDWSRFHEAVVTFMSDGSER